MAKQCKLVYDRLALAQKINRLGLLLVVFAFPLQFDIHLVWNSILKHNLGRLIQLKVIALYNASIQI